MNNHDKETPWSLDYESDGLPRAKWLSQIPFWNISPDLVTYLYNQY